ncbi:MAG: glycoside hydrolase family 27 protein [Bryobacteraceae bacterium]|jgi:alpha-galactosidase
MHRRLLFALASLVFAGGTAQALDNGLAKTPPMGWNSWNRFACNVSEDLVRQAADSMVKTGMKDAGYQYIVIDDCWQVSRDGEGNIVADPVRFRSGVKTLADYVHSLGLKMGIYSDAGSNTCGGRPGSRGHEFQDARQYARWGIDYLKYDWCNTTTQDAPASYATMRDALADSGRPIVFSICEWGNSKPWLWGAGVGNLWRTTTDILDRWEGKGEKYGAGVMDLADMQVGIEQYAGPGHWNDPDMLEVGNGGMTVTEYRSHFSLWAMLAAPLMAGNDLDHMTPEIHDILTNKEVVAVDQDSLGIEGRRVHHASDGQDVWVKPLDGHALAVLLLNRAARDQTITVTWSELGLAADHSAAVRDLWEHKDLGAKTGEFSAMVPSHGVAMVVVKP